MRLSIISSNLELLLLLLLFTFFLCFFILFKIFWWPRLERVSAFWSLKNVLSGKIICRDTLLSTDIIHCPVYVNWLLITIDWIRRNSTWDRMPAWCTWPFNSRQESSCTAVIELTNGYMTNVCLLGFIALDYPIGMILTDANCEMLFKWLKIDDNGRKQTEIIKCILSQWISTIASVPQGSIFGRFHF